MFLLPDFFLNSEGCSSDNELDSEEESYSGKEKPSEIDRKNSGISRKYSNKVDRSMPSL